MRAQIACVLLLCLTCGGLCSDIEQEQRALEEELLSSLFTSKIKPSRQSAPYWRVSLIHLCRMVNGPWVETWGSEERRGETEPEPLDHLSQLQHICRVLQPSQERQLQDSGEYLDAELQGDNPLKRKSPYILKRQVNTKSRRPYILKRSAFY